MWHRVFAKWWGQVNLMCPSDVVNTSEPMKQSLVITGIGPTSSGTGRFVSHIVDYAAKITNTKISILVRPEDEYQPRPVTGLVAQLDWVAKRLSLRGRVLWFSLKIILRGWVGYRNQVVIVHPQTLGMKNVLRVIGGRHRKTPILYLLDNSYFCIRSYNHLSNEDGPCLRCVGGELKYAREFQCSPYPVADHYAFVYIKKLSEMVQAKRVRLLAQNLSQAQLAERHFGLHRGDVHVVGLWTRDFDSVLASQTCFTTAVSTERIRARSVLFHGFGVDAKGASWCRELAREMPDIQFFFPFIKPKKWDDVPENCEFIRLTWETGLEQLAREVAVIIVPSLWSAPIEGALIKSLLVNTAVAVVDTEFAFQSEVKSKRLFRLKRNIEDAKVTLRELVDAAPARRAHTDQDTWMREFIEWNRHACDRIFNGE